MERISFFLARYLVAALTVLGVLAFLAIIFIFRLLGIPLVLWSAVIAVLYSFIAMMVFAMIIKRMETRAFDRLGKRMSKHRNGDHTASRGSLDDLDDAEIDRRLRR